MRRALIVSGCAAQDTTGRAPRDLGSHFKRGLTPQLPPDSARMISPVTPRASGRGLGLEKGHVTKNRCTQHVKPATSVEGGLPVFPAEARRTVTQDTPSSDFPGHSADRDFLGPAGDRDRWSPPTGSNSLQPRETGHRGRHVKGEEKVHSTQITSQTVRA